MSKRKQPPRIKRLIPRQPPALRDGSVTLTLPQAMQQAVTAYQRGDLAEAERLCRRVLNTQADHFDALNVLGVIAARTRRTQEAAELLERAVAANPGNASAHCNRGGLLNDLQRFDEALESYDRALQIKPDYAEAHYNRGNVLRDLKRFDEALASFGRAIGIKSDYAEACNNRGALLRLLQRFDEALDSYNRVLQFRPNHAETHGNCGIALKDLKRFDEALKHFDRALEIRPDYTEAHSNRGIVLIELKRFDEALKSFDRVIGIRPDHAEAHYNRGIVLRDLERFDEALASYDRAIEINPEYAEAHHNRGNAMADVRRLEEALASYARAFQLKPDIDYLYGARLYTKMRICDWQDLKTGLATVIDKIALGERIAPPFPILALSGSLPLQKKTAEIWMQERCPANDALPKIGRRSRHNRIRIGYFSADYHDHATAYLMAELFEKHDRSKFERTAFSFGPDKNDDMRQRIASAFDKFIDVRNQPDKEVALLARSLELDIAVDLKGYTQDSRPGIFAFGAAPVQVNYLGYPGTMGAEYIDYLIADSTLIPEHCQQHYSEKIAYLPNSYQVNDAQRRISDRVFTREELGLPKTGFVFCCFNNNYKITPGTFDGWMRILAQVAGSVLWLFEDNATASRNLRKEAEARGVDAARLIFAQRMPLAEHLARHRAADLFIDTLPCNAHTTASDALWAGLPVLTCMGESFASRVAASLLNAIQLPELITTTQEAYESLAIELATRRKRLEQIRQKLETNRLTTPLFDAALFARHIEDAYTQMVERYHADLPPEHIVVRP
jgi:predicted O-linked N-acetylglucosamine transferase (SPINDLY family)